MNGYNPSPNGYATHTNSYAIHTPSHEYAANPVNGYAPQGNGFANSSDLDEVNFEEPKTFNMKSFDAFPKTKPTYLTQTRTGGAWTVMIMVICASLMISESRRWFAGNTTQAFTVEKGISHDLQLNLDIVVKMHCEDLHVNIQDAAGDRVLAGDLLTKDPTTWESWKSKKGVHRLDDQRVWVDDGGAQYGKAAVVEDVHDYLGKAKKGKRKFRKTPSYKGETDACRIYGSVEGNKVQGDFHITARGHGYLEFAPHLDHDKFNFSHIINTLSFGPYYPNLVDPLDHTIATTEQNFYKFQYYANIVPTIYTEEPHHLSLIPPSLKKKNKNKDMSEPLQNVDEEDLKYLRSSSTVYTNQFAVTSQSHKVSEVQVPGVFVKYDIEPILLLVSEERGGMLALFVRLVNVVSGVLVAGTWCWQLTDLALDTFSKGRASKMGGERRGFLGFNVGGGQGKFV